MLLSKALLLGCIACSIGFTTPVFAVSINKSLDVQQGYNFQPNTYKPLGFIKTLSIGDLALVADQYVIDPTSRPSPGGTGIYNYPVVAVLSNVQWDGSPVGDIFLTGRISTPNKAQLALLMGVIGKKVVAISFATYEYSTTTKTYYPSFASYQGSRPSYINPPTTTNVIYGLAKTFTVNTLPSTNVLGAPNYVFNITLSPTVSSSPQVFKIQTSPTSTQFQPWGLPQASIQPTELYAGELDLSKIFSMTF
ncbi:MAG: hypothetical protein RM049_09560 [Nostoc sp. DedQUE04]|uniref:hypothetical protein n=1 Tax=Nostoc sp. DedQUE04 TaxID=3075390 RepID=UPI002AD2468F|nr:hypothetical protein [Nostoc sp. DedQUE04]MDZ8135535.1 hypothetical protein [Nostoc sp. DedQUE04]